MTAHAVTAAVRFVVALLALLAPLALAAAMLVIPVDEARADDGHSGFSGEESYPLHWAAEVGDLAAVVHLLGSAHGIYVNARSWAPFYQTPLHHAVKQGRATIVATLIAAGAAVNAKDNDGETPLRATWYNTSFLPGRAAVASVLIAAGGHWGKACTGAEVVNPAGPTTPCMRGDIPAECERLGGELQAAGGEDNRICSGVDWNDTFCILGSVDAFPCAYFFAHVKACNALDRPALDPWHCGPVCPNRGFATGAKCHAN